MTPNKINCKLRIDPLLTSLMSLAEVTVNLEVEVQDRVVAVATKEEEMFARR